jgi:hypothetical protein
VAGKFLARVRRKECRGVNAQEFGDSGHCCLIGSRCWSCGCRFRHARREGELLALGIHAAQVRRNSFLQCPPGRAGFVQSSRHGG